VILPVDVLARAGLAAGDELAVEVAGPGEVVLRRAGDPVARHGGALTGTYESDELERLRDEWP
jgi:bifunctional DNA-binding transcriptional regulator/antitoxin component of YhaV-PrlF toxin-antitoxin module